MHTKLNIFWDNDDPFPMGKRLDEAFSRVFNFCTELQGYPQGDKRPKELRSFNSIVNGSFDLFDLQIIYRYAFIVRERAHAAASEHPDFVADSIRQAGNNVLGVAQEIAEYVAKHINNLHEPIITGDGQGNPFKGAAESEQNQSRPDQGSPGDTAPGA